MGRRFAYVNEKQNETRIDRAVLRYHTLRKNGGSDVQIERAKTKIDALYSAKDVMHGRERTSPGDYN
jgi:hypothetical protein